MSCQAEYTWSYWISLMKNIKNKTMVLRVDLKTLEAFKNKCAVKGIGMSEKVRKFIVSEIRK